METPPEIPLSQLPKVRFTRVDPLDANIRVDFPDRRFSGVEFEPTPEKRYMFTVETRGMAPSDIQVMLQHVRKTITGFMPQGCKFLLVAVKNGMPELGIYEITPEP